MEMQLARKTLSSFTSPAPSSISSYTSTIAPNKSEYAPSLTSSYIHPQYTLEAISFELMTNTFDLGGDEWIIIRKEDLEVMSLTRSYVVTSTKNEGGWNGWNGCGILCTGQSDCCCGEDAAESKREWGMNYANVAKKNGGKEDEPLTLEERRKILEDGLGWRI